MFIFPFICVALFLGEMLFFGAFLVYIGMRNKGKHPYGFYSSLTAAVQVFFFALVVTFVSPFPKYPGMFPYPYPGFMQLWVGAWLAITVGFYLMVKRQKKRGSPPVQGASNDGVVTSGSGGAIAPASKKSTDPACDVQDGLKYKHEKARKAFHLAGLLIVLSYFLVAPLLSYMVNTWIDLAGPAYEALWGPISEAYRFSDTSLEQGAITLTLFALAATTYLVLVIDVFRLLAGEDYSIIKLVERRAGKILRDKEKGCPGAQDYIAISSTCAWVVGMAFQPLLGGGLKAIYIALAAIVISTLADGAAAIVGKSFGRHKVPRSHNQVKSIEGFIAGFVVAFVCAIFFTNWVVALTMAGLFLLIDYWSPPVADNAINAVTLTLAGCVIGMLV